MKVEEALNIIKQVASIYRGTLQEHNTIQQAISLIEKELNEKTISKRSKMEK